MRTRRTIAVLVGLGFPLLAAGAQATELKLFESNALKAVMEELGPQFEKASENKLVTIIGTTTELKARIDKGEAFDVALFTKAAVDDVARQGKIVDSSRVPIAHVGIGVAIRKGAPKPDLGTTEAFKRAVLNAKSIGYVAQTPTAAAMKVLFDKLGIADQVNPKVKLLTIQASQAVTNGDVELGLTQISEILPYPGVELVGPLPADIQTVTAFAAGIGSASPHSDAAVALIKFLTAPAAAAVIKTKGMEPG